MNINGRKIGYDQPPYVIAEMSCNHAGSFSNATSIIKDAACAGVDAVKVQAYDADSLTLPECGSVDGGLWGGRNLHNLYKDAAMPMAWLPDLFAYANGLGLTMFSSVYCMEGLAALEACECPAYKIASFEATHFELLEAVAKTGKPVIVSLGAVNDTEILEAVRVLSLAGCGEYALLHCVSQYPTPHDKANLARIAHLKRWVNGRALIGYSDHARSGEGMSGLAVAAGACILERHMNGYAYSEDSEFSDGRWAMQEYAEEAVEAWEAMKPNGTGLDAPRFKRSIRATQDIAEGEALTRQNVAVLRPSGGLHPRLLEHALSCLATRSIKRGDPIINGNIGA